MEQRLFDCGQYAVTVKVGDTFGVVILEDGYKVFSMNIENYNHGWHVALLEKALCHYIEFKDAYRISEWVEEASRPY